MLDESEALRALIRAVDLGEVVADEVVRAYMLGVADGLRSLNDDER